MMVSMNAMQSLLDPGMLYLDILSGTFGSALANSSLKHKNYGLGGVKMHDVVHVLIARIIVDYLFFTFVSKTKAFGGSMNEFLFSSALWFGTNLLLGGSVKDNLVKFGTTFLVMLAIAKVTNWG